MNVDLTDCVISRKQAQFIQKCFRSFCLNKVQNKQTGEIIKSDAILKNECSFVPKVSEYSRVLTEKNRKGSCSPALKLYESCLKSEKLNQEWRTTQKQLQEKEMMKECTFTPEVNTYSRNDKNSSIACKTNDCEKSVGRSSKLSSSRNTTNLASSTTEKNRKQSYRSLRRGHKSEAILKHAHVSSGSMQSIEENVKRMREANFERDVIKIMKERGV